MSRTKSRRLNVFVLGIGLALMLLALCPCALALNPALDISQYAHASWKVRDGFFKGAIRGIAQTPDGYLWVGTDFGLLRFDGIRAVPWQPPAGEHLPGGRVNSLLGAHDGTLWIGTDEGLASWNHGKFTVYAELAGRFVNRLLEDREGSIWIANATATVGRLCAIQKGRVQCYGEDGRLGRGAPSFYEDSKGNLWAGGTNGLWRWKPGPPEFYPMPSLKLSIFGFAESDNGTLLLATGDGIGQFVDGKVEEYPLPGGEHIKAFFLLRDRDGGLWVTTVERGLVHVQQGRVDVFGQADGLTSDFDYNLFEDREGNIWVGTLDGLDRFRDFAVPTISVKQGLPNSAVMSVLAATDGSVWLGTLDGLDRWRNGQITIYRKRSAQTASGGAGRDRGFDVAREITDSGLPDDKLGSLFQDERGRIWVTTQSGVAYLENNRFIPVSGVPIGVSSVMTGDGVGNLWISQREALFHLHGETVVERIPWDSLGLKDFAVALLSDPVQRGLWLGLFSGGVAYLKDGQVRASYAAADGLGAGRVYNLQLDRDGALWAATKGGLSRVKNGQVATLTSKNGLPCDTVHWMTEDDDHSVWLSTACGLLRVPRSELDAWAGDPKRTIRVTVFDSSDGVRSNASATGSNPLVAKTADGRLWFLPFDGVSVIDPRHLPVNKIPPPVHIEQITADRKTYDVSQGLRLPSGVRDLEIDYTALSFVAPEKVRFRVKLEGSDADWKDAGTERKAFYSNLPPRNYRFRVIACNNSGVWNEEGAFFDFSIAPAFYQRTSVRVLAVVLFLALLFAAYQLRVRQLAHQFNRTLEVRVSERTRIARELHDTLLQSFQGLLLRFQSVLKILPERPLEARQRLENALDQATEAITEGRDAVQGLRSSASETNDLSNAIIAIGKELTRDASFPDSPAIDVEVEGAPRDLNPVVRDEAYRIAGEALRNAFRHARARHITVEIRYDKRQFCLRVRDDGKGIDEETMRREPAGHFGLPGMRERAEIVGGRLEVWSKLDSGTQIELSIPGAIAYGVSARRAW